MAAGVDPNVPSQHSASFAAGAKQHSLDKWGLLGPSLPEDSAAEEHSGRGLRIPEEDDRER